MKLAVNVAGASREELIELTGQLISIIEAQGARIAELEGQRKPPDTGLKGHKPPRWVKANKPAHPKRERQKRAHGFARRREEPTHRAEHAMTSCPEFRTPLGGREGALPPPDYIHTPNTDASDGARGVGTDLPQVRPALGPRTGLGRPDRGEAAGGHLSAE